MISYDMISNWFSSCR